MIQAKNLMKSKPKKAIDQSTEEKIKAAAYKLFTRKGYAGTRTRDIAEEAGINLALLNYYFRSKEKLFDLIMADNMKQFMFGIFAIANDEKTGYEDKITRIVNAYIDMLTVQPDMPIFVLSEIRYDPGGLIEKMKLDSTVMHSYFVKQLKQAIEAGEIEPINPLQILMNILGLTIFPFIGSPLLKKIGGMADDQFTGMMQERKKMIPIWIKEMLKEVARVWLFLT